MASSSTYPEDALLEALRETDLDSFQNKLCHDLQLTRLEHFDHVQDDELQALAGLSAPAIRRLRAAIDEKKKRAKKRSIFGTLNRKDSSKTRSTATFLVNPNHTDEQPGGAAGSTSLISKEQLKLMERLGEGSFAIVKRAIWTQDDGRKTDVAVKLLRDSSPTVADELQLEVNNMHKLRHPNLIRLHGLVFANPIMMVVELCDGGALLDRLRDTNKPVLLASQLIDYSVQIAKGMAYLESKRFIHRDLATRNVLLTANERVVKIGDFGLMRALPDKDEHYVMSAQKKVPFAWCPPESLRRRQFSHASDVWSFGVTVWEIFSYGEEPWCGYRGPEILQRITNGETLPKPSCSPKELYELMLQCWSINPEQRPRFVALKDLIKELQFSVGECREVQKGEGLLESELNDKIIIVDGSPESFYWFGQNVRTRKYGKFSRKSIFFRARASLRNPRDISRPIKGSFIHAGHGDARGGDSWGQADKIDPIYLRNPMPVEMMEPLEPRAIRGAEVVESIMGLRSNRQTAPTPLRPPPPSSRPSRSGEHRRRTATDVTTPLTVPSATTSTVEKSRSSGGVGRGGTGSSEGSEEIDPFAPFDDYDDVGFEINGATASSSSAGSQAAAAAAALSSSPHNYYDPPPPQTGEASSPARPSMMSAHHPALPIPPPTTTSLTNGLSASALAEHQRNRDLAIASVVRSLQASSSSPSHPEDPVPQRSNFAPSPETHHRPIVIPQPPPPAVPQVLSGTRDSSMSITQPVWSLPKPPSSSPRNNSTTFFPSTSQDPNEPDPFEVPSSVRQLASRPRYSQVYQDTQTPSTSSVRSRPSATPTTSGAYWSGHANDSGSAYGQHQHQHQHQYNPSGQMISELSTRMDRMSVASTTSSSGFQRSSVSSSANYGGSIYQHPSSTSSMTALEQLSSASRQQPPASAQIANSASSRVPVNMRPASGSILTPEIRQSKSRSASDLDTKALLDMFDPLSSKPPNDRIAAVVKEAPFVSQERCIVMLKRCQNDVQAAIRELKIEKLVDMGLVPDREIAMAVLESANWDPNAAAEKLLG